MLHGALFLVTLFYGGNYSIAQFAMPAYIQPFAFIVVRVTTSCLLFWIIDSFAPKEKIASARDYWLLIKCAFFGASMNQLIFFEGLSMTQPINASIIMTTSPILVLVVASIIGEERITRLKVAGVLLGGIGAFFLLTKGEISLEKGAFLGDIMVLLNASFYATYLVLVRQLMLRYRPGTVIMWVFLFGAFMVIPFGTHQLISMDWQNFAPIAWLSLGYVIVGVTVLTYLLNGWALQFVHSSVVGAYIYLQPVLASVIAVALGKDSIEWDEVFFTLIIMSGVYLVSKK